MLVNEFLMHSFHCLLYLGYGICCPYPMHYLVILCDFCVLLACYGILCLLFEFETRFKIFSWHSLQVIGSFEKKNISFWSFSILGGIGFIEWALFLGIMDIWQYIRYWFLFWVSWLVVEWTRYCLLGLYLQCKSLLLYLYSLIK